MAKKKAKGVLEKIGDVMTAGAEAVDGGTPRRLLAEATRLFAERGYEGTSVSEIVRAAGVTKGAMYHHFAAKDDLLYEIYHQVIGAQLAGLERIQAPGRPARGQWRCGRPARSRCSSTASAGPTRTRTRRASARPTRPSCRRCT